MKLNFEKLFFRTVIFC